MFEPNEDVNFGQASTHPPIFQRTGSAPVLSENGNDNMLPKYYGGEEPGYYNSRMSTRLPITKHEPGTEESFNQDFLEEVEGLTDDASKGLISSLIIDPKRTPLDLIQEDFPATPSSIYSNRLLANAEGRFDQGLADEETELLNTSTRPGTYLPQGQTSQKTNTSRLARPSGSGGQLPAQGHQASEGNALDQATLSMQQLYVGDEARPAAGDITLNTHQPNNVHMPAHAHISQQQQQQPHMTLSSSAATQSGGSTGGASHMRNRSVAGPAAINQNYTALHHSDQQQQQQQQQQQNQQQQQQQHHMMPPVPGGPVQQAPPPPQVLPQQQQQQQAMQYYSVDANGQPVTGPAVPQQGGGAYYMPPHQPMYLDQNGQPVYYRVAPGAQFQHEVMYATNPDGTPGEPMHMSYMPSGGYYMPGAPQMAGPQDQSQVPGNSPPMYHMQGPGGAQAQMDMRPRMIYNPTTGQYTNVNTGAPVPAGMHTGRAGPATGMYPAMMQQGQMLHAGHPHGHHPMNMMMPQHMRGGDGSGGGGEMLYHPHRDDGSGGMSMMGGGDYRNDPRLMHRHHEERDDRGAGGRDRYRDDGRGGGAGRDNRFRRNDRGMSNPMMGGGGGGGGGMNSGANPVRDPLVDDFRSTYGKSRQWGLRDLLGHVVAFCQDQHGSRFIQQRLEVCADEEKQIIFDEIISCAHSLMTDVFGNYVLQKLFEFGTSDQCENLAALLTGQCVQLSMQMYGCRVVQKALEYVNTQRLVALVTEFESPAVLLHCVHDSNGNHVIQKCIEVTSRTAKEAGSAEMTDYLNSRIQFIIDAFKGKVKELSSHPYGCRVVQRILEHCAAPQKTVILEELRQCCADLVQDCYGNYVIQFVMQHGWEADRSILIREVQAHLLDFSQHKFASNVVEKCLQYASKRDRDEMIWTIINVTFDMNNPVDAKGHCVLESMVRDPYANYVVQKVIDVSDERQRSAIMRYVRENIVQLRRYTYGKHIIVRLEKITNEKF